MSRNAWLIVASICCVIVLLVAMAVFFAQNLWGDRILGGPIAIVERGRLNHGFLGIQFDDANQTPLTIRHVLKGSGAADAMLQSGDVILSVGGTDKPDLTALHRITEDTTPGEKLLLKIGRETGVIEVRVRLISIEELIKLQEQDQDQDQSYSPP